MKCVSYNIQYGIGLDKHYDLPRIVDAVRDADIICLQEVSRNNPQNGGRDMVGELRDLLPDRFAVHGPNFEVDLGSAIENGRAIDRHFSLGNMILSKTPILASRNLLLPRRRSIDRLNFQRGALEALIGTPLGPMRFYSVHLDHRSPDERMLQIEYLMRRVLAFRSEGGALTGTSEMGFAELPRPEAAIVMGDFNMLPGSPEYLRMTGAPDHEFGLPLVADRMVDAAARLGDDTRTWVDPEQPDDASRFKRIDYCFLSADVAARLAGYDVDMAAKGSDHLPLWIELN